MSKPILSNLTLDLTANDILKSPATLSPFSQNFVGLRSPKLVDKKRLFGNSNVGSFSGIPLTPSSIYNPKGITEEQEQFANDFSNHFNSLKQGKLDEYTMSHQSTCGLSQIFPKSNFFPSSASSSTNYSTEPNSFSILLPGTLNTEGNTISSVPHFNSSPASFPFNLCLLSTQNHTITRSNDSPQMNPGISPPMSLASNQSYTPFQNFDTKEEFPHTDPLSRSYTNNNDIKRRRLDVSVSSVTSTTHSSCNWSGIEIPTTPTQVDSKLELKRTRNREAAKKCREKKYERITSLENEIKQIKSKNKDLKQTIADNQQKLCELKEILRKHELVGCDLRLVSALIQ